MGYGGVGATRGRKCKKVEKKAKKVLTKRGLGDIIVKRSRERGTCESVKKRF